MFLNVSYQWQAPFLYVFLLINLKFAHWPLYVWQYQNMCFYFFYFYLFVCTLWLFYLFCSDKSRATFLAALFKMSPCADLGLLTRGVICPSNDTWQSHIVQCYLALLLYIFRWYFTFLNVTCQSHIVTEFCNKRHSFVSDLITRE